MNLPQIKIVVQWRAAFSLCTLWQQFGQAAHGGENRIAILLVEKKDTDEEWQAKAKKDIATGLKKAKEKIGTNSVKRKSVNQLNPAAKRQALTNIPISALNGCDATNLATPGSPPSELAPLEVLK